MTNNQWLYNSEALTEIPQKAIGFVYMIYNPESNRSYIGKKLFRHKRNKKTIESDWKTYTGSNKVLNEEIKTSNPPLVKTILYICYSKSECSYLELQEQIQHNAILSPHFYNDWISVKVTRKQLDKFIKREYNSLYDNDNPNSNNHNGIS